MDASVLAACAIHMGFGLCRNLRLRAFRISSYGVRASGVQGWRPAVFLYPVGVVIGRIGYRRGAAAKAMLRGTWASVKSRMTGVDSLPFVTRIRDVRDSKPIATLAASRSESLPKRRYRSSRLNSKRCEHRTREGLSRPASRQSSNGTSPGRSCHVAGDLQHDAVHAVAGHLGDHDRTGLADAGVVRELGLRQPHIEHVHVTHGRTPRRLGRPNPKEGLSGPNSHGGTDAPDSAAPAGTGIFTRKVRSIGDCGRRWSGEQESHGIRRSGSAFENGMRIAIVKACALFQDDSKVWH